MLDALPNICKAQNFSDARIKLMKTELAPLEGADVSVVVNGSYARREASGLSDVDYFLLIPPEMPDKQAGEYREFVNEIVEKVGGRLPSSGGAFAGIERRGEFAAQIGGNEDDNQTITRRILLLIEGRSLVGGAAFECEREAVLGKYIRDGITDHQLALFLLNDIIRYYRTVCVDFEQKTVQSGKPWGIRNIKLVFSRKMLYFGGILIVAETAQRSKDEKVAAALRLMRMTPIERVMDICGASAERALRDYDYFLGEMEKPEVREHLNRVPECRTGHTEVFKSLKNRGHHFTMHLMSALRQAYSENHPIHRALVM